jgi:hypothetical protein
LSPPPPTPPTPPPPPPPVRAGAEVELIARIRAGQTTVELLDLPPTTTNGASP